jgi:hypothetical protein
MVDNIMKRSLNFMEISPNRIMMPYLLRLLLTIVAISTISSPTMIGIPASKDSKNLFGRA